jgi:hypothetical protein
MNQMLATVAVGNSLIISGTGTKKLVEADPTTREMSIFKDLYDLGSWLLDIDYSNGMYYLAQHDNIVEFAELGEPEVLCNIPDGFMLYLAVVGKYVYAADRNAGKIYKVDIFTGESEVLVEGLVRPEDIEFLPVALQSP